MDEFITRFTSLLRYVPYIREEKANVQRFVSSLPPYMRERIEFDNPKSMDEAIRKDRIFYQQSKQKGEAAGRKWNEKKNFKSIGSNRGNCSGRSKGNDKGLNSRIPSKYTSKLKIVNESRGGEQHARLNSEGTVRPPVQCWGCGGPHYVKSFPQPLEVRQAEYQPTMVEFEGKISYFPIAVLIDLGATLSYMSPKLVERRKLQLVKFKIPWLVQLATGAKRRVMAKIDNCSFTIAEQPIVADLNILPLGSYDILIGMYWLEKHWSLVECKTKVIYYKYQHENRKEMQGIKRPMQIRPITATQLAKCIWKRCQIYAI
eukprot:PITA_09134